MWCPNGFAGDPAPQQLTAPCRKYTGRLHHTIEQGAYPLISSAFSRIVPRPQQQFSGVRLRFCLGFAASLLSLMAGSAAASTPQLRNAQTPSNAQLHNSQNLQAKKSEGASSPGF